MTTIIKGYDMNKQTIKNALDYGKNYFISGTYIIGDYTVKVERIDDLDESPREWDNAGTMLCWHNLYNLGDKHSHDDPNAARLSLACELDSTVESRIDYWENGKGWVSIAARADCFEECERRVQNIIEKALSRAIILPLYLYDHSGISMSTGGFSCAWDSGQVGFIYMLPDTIERDWGKGRKARAKAEACMRAEVETYDDYLTGNVHYYSIERDDDVIASCGGYYGSDSEYIADCIADEILHDVDSLRKAKQSQIKTWIINRVPLEVR